MHATQLHPHRALVAALVALALALLAFLPAALDNASFSIGGDRSGATDIPAPAVTRTQAEPAWRDNPFAWPLLQVRDESVRRPMQ